MEQLAVTTNLIGYGSDGQQYLSFALGDEEYGLEILRVQEIKGYSTITPIPNTPPHIKGVINLRGSVVPVVDLRAKFGMPEAEYTKFTVIILVNVRGKVLGLVVDGVSDVLSLASHEIQATPEFDDRVDVRFISGMVNVGEKLVVLLDIDKLLGEADVLSCTAAG